MSTEQAAPPIPDDKTSPATAAPPAEEKAADTSVYENAPDDSFGTANGGNEDSAAVAGHDNDASADGPYKLSENITDSELNAFREQDRFLPIANVGRIMKNCLPLPTKVSKEAKECVQECTSEFISFVTSEASERCAMEKRKTLNGEDILFAMINLGFENYAEVLKIYLSKYRGLQRVAGKRSGKKRRLDGESPGEYDDADGTYDNAEDDDDEAYEH